MRLITLSLFAVFAFLLVGTACGQEQGENGQVEWLRLISAVLGILSGLLGLIGGLGRLLRHRGAVRSLGQLEMFESNRVIGGTIGAGVGGLFLLASSQADLQAGPIICLALYGGVFGSSRARILGAAIGAVSGLGLNFLSIKVFESAFFLASVWWFVASFIPLGGLLAGINDRRETSSQTARA